MSTENNKTILVTGCGGPAGVNFLKSLRIINREDLRLIGTDCNSYHLTLAKEYLNKSYLIEPCTNRSTYLNQLKNIIDEENVDLVHPQPDVEVAVISEFRDVLYNKVFLPKKETIKTCQNKYATAFEWHKNGYDTLPIIISDAEDINYAFRQFNRVYWLRSAYGTGGRGSTPIRNTATAKAWIKYWRSRGAKDNFIAQKYLPGRNIAFHSVWCDGELVTSQARERVEYIYPYLSPSGITGTPAVQRTIVDAKVNRTAIDSILCIDDSPDGIFCVDLKEDEKGKPQPTEINAGRFFTTSYFFSKASVDLNIPLANMPYMFVKLGLGEEIPMGYSRDVLPKNLYWIRQIDCGEVLINGKNKDPFN